MSSQLAEHDKLAYDMIVPLEEVEKGPGQFKLASGMMEENNPKTEEENETIRQIMKHLAKAKITTITREEMEYISLVSFTIRKALRPIDFLMKLCGLTYGSSCPLIVKFQTRHKVQRVYTIMVAILLFFSALRYMPSLFQQVKVSPLIKYEYLLWNVKCAIQAFYCIFICSRYGREISRFQQLISEYDEQLSRYRDSQDREEEQRYKTRTRLVTIALFSAVIATMAITGCCIFIPSLVEEKLNEFLIGPFKEPTLPVKLLLFIISFYSTVAWLLPVILYCYLCLSFCLVLDQFKASLASFKSSNANKCIEYVSVEYKKLKELISHTDDVIGFMALCVYCFDVILCCFHLFHFFYESKTAVEKIAPAYHVVVSLANLVFMSFCASKVSEKVRKL